MTQDIDGSIITVDAVVVRIKRTDPALDYIVLTISNIDTYISIDSAALLAADITSCLSEVHDA